MTTILSLRTERYCKIFSYLSVYDNVRAKAVCSFWKPYLIVMKSSGGCWVLHVVRMKKPGSGFLYGKMVGVLDISFRV